MHFIVFFPFKILIKIVRKKNILNIKITYCYEFETIVLKYLMKWKILMFELKCRDFQLLESIQKFFLKINNNIFKNKTYL